MMTSTAQNTLPPTWIHALARVLDRSTPRKQGVYRTAFERLANRAEEFEIEKFDAAVKAGSTAAMRQVWKEVKKELEKEGTSVDSTPGIRRETLHFMPGDLGVKVIPFKRPMEFGEFEGCVQRPINSDRLKRLERVGLDRLVTESFSRPIVFFEGSDGQRRLAGGHHRLTLADRADHPTDWVIEIRTRESWDARGDWLAQLAAMNVNEGGHVRTDEIVLHPNFKDWRDLIPENLMIYSGQDVSVFGILDGRTLVDWYTAEGRLRYKANPEDRVETMGRLKGELLKRTVNLALRWRDLLLSTASKKTRKYLSTPVVIGAWLYLAERYPEQVERMMERIKVHLEMLDLTAKASVPDAMKALLNLINWRVRSEYRLSADA
jgi:hypothetical protein